MPAKVAINGFGRIGRLCFRAMREHCPEVEVVAVNDITTAEVNAHLLKHDSNYGPFPGTVAVADGKLTVDGRSIQVLSERDPAKAPWKSLGVDVVVESTGVFTSPDKARAHLDAGAKYVILSAPWKGETEDTPTVVLGCNEKTLDPSRHRMISNASCTTNCLAPVCKVLDETFGIAQGFMTTVHAYTNDQMILDQAHKSDLRRARSAGGNIIPTSTGAAKAIHLVLPQLKGKMNGIALRVPVPTVSLVDLVVNTEKPMTAPAVNEAFRKAAEGGLKGLLGYTEEPIVSSDIKGDPHSAVVDGLETMVIGDRMAKILAWYDNEWGYSCRLADLVRFVTSR